MSTPAHNMVDENSAKERFYTDRAHDTALIDYPLDGDSVVFELGGFAGEWSEKIYSKYKCNLFIFEPVGSFYQSLLEKFRGDAKVKIFNYGILNKNDTLDIGVCNDGSSFFSSSDTVQRVEVKSIENVLVSLGVPHVDLIQINIEGSEYALLDYMIDANLVSLFRYIQIQFHKNVPDAEIRRDRIVQGLEKTHTRIFNYEFVFESWKIK